MGDGAREAMENGLCENFSKDTGRKPLWWRDVCYVSRPIQEMDPLHLCFVLNYQLVQKSHGRWFEHDWDYYNQMRSVLWFRNWHGWVLEQTLKAFREGTYQMYPDGDGRIEEYYRKLLQRYPNYDWKPLLHYVNWD